jgi:hypothetical protein
MMTCTQLKVQASVSLDRALSPEDWEHQYLSTMLGVHLRKGTMWG